MSKVCLFGASGHGKVIKDVLESQGSKVIFFIDDFPKSDKLLGVSVFKTAEINQFLSDKFIISIGDNSIRKKISKTFVLKYTKAIASQAIISKSSSVLEGTVVMMGAIINADTAIGKHCIINTNSVIEHDCIIGDYVHISPNATITGNVTIGEGTQVGAGAIVIPNINIGKWVTVGAGAVILKDVPDYATIVGNPARLIDYKKIKDE